MLMLETNDQVGALMHLLEPFVKQGINVRKIENSTSSAAKGRALLPGGQRPSERCDDAGR